MKKTLLTTLAVAFTTSAAAQSALPLPPAEGKTKYPLQLKTPYGTTTLKARPVRVAVVGGTQDFEAVLELGVKPVVAPKAGWPWQTAALQKLGTPTYTVIEIWAEDGLPFETIAAAKPDVILAISKYKLEDDYKKLAQIAPVVALESNTASSDVTGVQALRRVGQVLDLQSRAERVLQNEKIILNNIITRHPEYKGKTVAVLMNGGEKVGLSLVNHAGSPTEKLFSTLGFAPHPQAALFSQADGTVKMEQLSRVNADVLIVVEHGGGAKSSDAKSWLERQPLYQALPVVKRGMVSLILPEPNGSLPLAWSLVNPNPLSTEWTLGKLETAFKVIKK